MAVAIKWISLGYMHYDEALDIQLTRARELQSQQDENQTVFTVEHPATITIGRNGTTDHILADEDFLHQHGFVVRHVDRGGDVTYHGPGQLVVYPVFHLADWANDVKKFVRNLEEVVIEALATVDIRGERMPDYPGVWVDGSKICAVGARVQKRSTGEFITYHGIALNVNTNLADFETIVPCGIADKEVTSVERELGQQSDLLQWESKLRSSFANVFGASISQTISNQTS